MKKKIIIIGIAVFIIVTLLIIKNRKDRLAKLSTNNGDAKTETIMNYDEETRVILCDEFSNRKNKMGE